MEHQYYPDRPHNIQSLGNSSGMAGGRPSGMPTSDALSLDKKRETRRRTKTGCATCRKRRIKCDEGKPECLRCLKSKRPCEGYNIKTVFKNENALHYQQSIRPSPAFSGIPSGYADNQMIQFSTPHYRNGSLSHSFDPGQNFNIPHSVGIPNAHYLPMTQPIKGQIEPNSRNSSASNASGVSANSEQRRISVLSLMSSDKDTNTSNPRFATNDEDSFPSTIVRTTETDARDNFYYNFYISNYAYILARKTPAEASELESRDHPLVLWTQVVPSLINEDPPGRRPLFEAVVAYTAHIRFETIPIDYEIRSSGEESRLIELALKAYIDIIRGTARTISMVDALLVSPDPLCATLRWGLLQHTIVQVLADAIPRISWINLLCSKALGTQAFEARSEMGQFYLASLRHISANTSQVPQTLLDFHGRHDLLSIPGMDITYFALIRDVEALKNIAYHILASPRLEYLHMVYQMLNGARTRGQAGLQPLLNDLTVAMRQC